MSLRNYTAADLGITGPHLIAHTLDGDRLIVEEVLGYVVDRCNVTTRTKEWTAVHTYRAPGSVEPITGRVPVRRLRVAGLHCDGANQLVPQEERGAVGGSVKRANGAAACDNGEADEAAPTGVRQHSSRGLTTGTSPRPLSPRRQA